MSDSLEAQSDSKAEICDPEFQSGVGVMIENPKKFELPESTRLLFTEFENLETLTQSLRNLNRSDCEIHVGLPRHENVEKMLEWLMPNGKQIKDIQSNLGDGNRITGLVPRMPESVMNEDADDSVREVIDLFVNYFENNLSSPAKLYFDLLFLENWSLRIQYLVRTLDLQNDIHNRRQMFKNIPLLGFACTQSSFQDNESVTNGILAYLIKTSLEEQSPLMTACDNLPVEPASLLNGYHSSIGQKELNLEDILDRISGASSPSDTVAKEDNSDTKETICRTFIRVFK